jgi:hypothetical protein
MVICAGNENGEAADINTMLATPMEQAAASATRAQWQWAIFCNTAHSFIIKTNQAPFTVIY